MKFFSVATGLFFMTTLTSLTGCNDDANPSNSDGSCTMAAHSSNTQCAPGDGGGAGGTPPEYDFKQQYAANSLVTYKSVTYTNKWWANPGQCPVQNDCPSDFQSGQWVTYDPSKKHEFAYYDYPSLQKYHTGYACTSTDYVFNNISETINASALSGEISKAAPAGGYRQQDLDALYREYMLPCQPNISSYIPDNVLLVKKVLPIAVWNTLSASIYQGDSGLTYPKDQQSLPWPAEEGFKAEAYENFLYAVARYPYFCGERGYFGSIEEACKREIASLFAHASQETGNTKINESFYWLREYGYVDTDRLDPATLGQNCNAPFDCSNTWAHYYGRGPKQLSYYYNYAGFSAAYFNGDYNFLLKWPDMVAYDGEMYFAAAIWYMMTNQPPKPSIHDILLGNYKTTPNCLTTQDCNGIQYDEISGVKNNFDITIEAINGSVECRASSSQNYVNASRNRSNNYIMMLKMLNAVLTGAEESLPIGCAFIAQNFTGTDTVFGSASLRSNVNTWLDVSGSTCQAQSNGGNAMISVTASGIVDACKSK